MSTAIVDKISRQYVVKNCIKPILRKILILPMCWFLIDLIRSDLIKLTSFETICRKCSAETTSSIESDSIFSYTESLSCPVSIDDKFVSCIVLIPGLSLILSYCGSIFYRRVESIVWMESSMNNDKILSFDNTRK